MAKQLPWTPWHRVVKLREDVRTGELSLADFAADLHDVMMQRGARPIYEDSRAVFCADLPDLFAPGACARRGSSALGPEHEGGTAA